MSIRMFACVAALGSLSAPAAGQTFLLSENTKTLTHSYLDCVVNEASKLEAAKEPIGETVELAKTACARHKQTIALNVMQDVNTEFAKSSGETRIFVAQKLRETVEEQVTQEARLRLARIRSERANAAD